MKILHVILSVDPQGSDLIDFVNRYATQVRVDIETARKREAR